MKRPPEPIPPLSDWRSRLLGLKLQLLERLLPRPDSALWLWAVLAGVMGALATAGFREAIDLVEWGFTQRSGDLVAVASALSPWQRVLVPTVGGLLAGAVLLIARRVPGAQSAPDYMEAIAAGDGRIAARQTLLRSLSSLCSVSSGAAIGREGAMVQLGAMAASVMGRYADFNAPRLRLLTACGAAGGIASAYHAPIAGALFVSEIVLGSVSMAGMGPMIVASVSASIVTHQVVGYRPTYDMPAFAPIGGADVLPFVLLGLLAGLVAPLFLWLLERSKTLLRGLGLPLVLQLGLGGLVVGLTSLWAPQTWGNGYSVVNAILGSTWTWQALALVLVLKVLATSATVGSGAVGGVFTPTLFVGAALGALFAHAMNGLFPGSVVASACAAVAMGAMLAATTHAPLMSILMVSEMTMSYEITLPLMLACVGAYTVARVFRPESIYAASLRRQQEAEGAALPLHTRVGDLLKPDRRPVLRPGMGLAELAQTFSHHRVQFLYLMDEQQGFLGAVSLHDVAQALAHQAEPPPTASDLVLRDFPVLRPQMDLGDALQVFARHHGERLPVVSEGMGPPQLLGAVSKTDVMLLMGQAPQR